MNKNNKLLKLPTKYKKNSSMGFLPLDFDRSIFVEFNRKLSALHPFAYEIVYFALNSWTRQSDEVVENGITKKYFDGNYSNVFFHKNLSYLIQELEFSCTEGKPRQVFPLHLYKGRDNGTFSFLTSKYRVKNEQASSALISENTSFKKLNNSVDYEMKLYDNKVIVSNSTVGGSVFTPATPSSLTTEMLYEPPAVHLSYGSLVESKIGHVLSEGKRFSNKSYLKIVPDAGVYNTSDSSKINNIEIAQINYNNGRPFFSNVNPEPLSFLSLAFDNFIGINVLNYYLLIYYQNFSYSSGTYFSEDKNTSTKMDSQARFYLTTYGQNYSLSNSWIERFFNDTQGTVAWPDMIGYVSIVNNWPFVTKKLNFNPTNGRALYKSMFYFISVLKQARDFLLWAESDNFEVRVESNFDFTKIQTNEQFIQNQLNFMNSMSDTVQREITNEKIEWQKKKDELLAEIESKKQNLANAIDAKRAMVKNLLNAKAGKDATLNNYIVELEKRYITE